MPPSKSEPSNLPPPTRHSSSPPPSPTPTTPAKMEPQTSSSAPKPDPTSTPVPPEPKPTETKPMNLTSDDDTAPPSAQPPPTPPSQSHEVEQEAPLDPAEQIPAFDWQQLHESYHHAMTNASKQEAALLQEFASLMDYFKIWADAGSNQESDRTFHRLRTRMTYVQHSEDRLEKTRQHYVEVVRAFESALGLLRSAGFGG